MNCPEVRERLSDHALGESSTRDRVLIEGHLAGCAECAAEREGLRETIDLLAAHEWSAGEDLAEMTPERRQRLEERAARKPRRWNGLLLKLAAVLTVVTGAGSVLFAPLYRARVADRGLYIVIPSPSAVGDPRRGFPHPASPARPSESLGPSGEVDFSTPERGLPRSYAPEAPPATTATGAPPPALSRPGENAAFFAPQATSPPADLDRLRALGYAEPAGSKAGADRDVAKVEPHTHPRPPQRRTRAGHVLRARGHQSVRGDRGGRALHLRSRRGYRVLLDRPQLPLPGRAPSDERGRVEEFVNAFPQDYRADPGKTFTVHAGGCAQPVPRRLPPAARRDQGPRGRRARTESRWC